MQKKILIIGLSKDLELINFFKKITNRIIVLDNFKKKNIIFKNLKNLEECFKAVKNLKITHSISDQSDIAIKAYGFISNRLNLYSIPYKKIKIFTNKFLCRSRLFLNKNLKKNIPRFYKLNHLKDIDNIKYNKNGFIVKPIESQGSRNTFKFRNNKQIKNFFLSNNYKEFIIEDYVNGKDISVEGFVEDKNFFLLSISKKKKFKNSFVDRELIYTNFEKKNKLKLKNICDQIIKTINLSKGLFHAEFKLLKNNKIFLIEATCRGPGSGVASKILNLIKRFSYKEYLKSLCFNYQFKHNINFNLPIYNHVILGWYQFKNKKVKKINIEGVRKKNYLVDIEIKKNYQNKNLSIVNNSSDRYLRYIVKGNNYLDLIKKKRQLLKLIKVQYY